MKIAKNKTPDDRSLSIINGNHKNTQEITTTKLDEIILKRLESECFGSRTIEVYGGAYNLAKKCDNPSLQDVAVGMVHAINNAQYWTPKVSAQDVARRFCSLFYVDYMLIEVLIGIKF